MNGAADVPLLPPRLRRLLAAVWISIGLHAALLALVHVAPPSTAQVGEPVIEARLVPAPRVAPAIETPTRAAVPERSPAPPQREARLAPSEHAEALPVAPAVAEPPVPAAPPAAASPAPSGTAPAPAAAPAAPGITIPSVVDLTYYAARDWGVPPRALRKVEPDYPDDADRQRLSGSVRLQLKLEEDGRISDIKVVSATPPGVFEESAIKAFRNVRFSPAQRNGQPVRALVLITVEFDWAGRR